MSDGKLSVELRLVLDKLKGDIKAAADAIKINLEGELAKGGSAADDMAEGLKKVAARTRNVSDELKKQIDEWRKLQTEPVITIDGGGGEKPQENFDEWNRKRLEEERGTGDEALKRAQEHAAANAAAHAAANPPTPPPIIPRSPSTSPTPPGGGGAPPWLASLLNQVRGPGGAGLARNVLAGVGMSYGGQAVGAAASGPLGMVAAGLQISLMMLRKAINDTVTSFQRAAAIYSQMLQRGGLPMGVAVRENVLGRVLGVGANEVRQYGIAVQHVSEQVNRSINELTKNIPVMTAVAWQWRSFLVSIEAAWSQFAAALAPSLINLAKAMRTGVEIFTELRMLETFGFQINMVITAFVMHLKLLETVFLGVAAAVAFVIESLVNMVMELKTLGKWDSKFEATEAFMQRIRDLHKSEGPAPGGPQSFSNRMPGSTWERMGLVVGGLSSTDFARQTATATKKSAELLAAIKDNLAPRESGNIIVSVPAAP